MDQKRYILGIDAGTSRIKVLIADREAQHVGFNSSEIPKIVPKQGYVEQDPLLIWNTAHDLISGTLSDSGLHPDQIAAIGIANQRDTTVCWNNFTGMPYGNAVVWLDKRASSLCTQASEKLGPELVERVGMYVLPNTTALHIKWLLDNDVAIQKGAQKGEICFGTVNSWLLWRLTGGKAHCSDLANMSVTMLQNARELSYDREVIQYLGISEDSLPVLRGTGEIYGKTSEELFSGARITVAGMLGDQMASALGQGCVRSGMAKNTYGTGGFLLLNTGTQYFPPANGLFSSFLWGDRHNQTYGLEAFSETCGTAVEWLKTNMGLIDDPAGSEDIARSVRGGEPLYFVPAFTGLATPHLDPLARGAVFGITAQTTAADLVKAVLDGIVYQTTDMIKAMESVTGREITVLRVDGGLARNDYICQFQADMLDRPVERPKTIESTVLGAVYQAGLTVGFWRSLEEIASLVELEKRFEPGITRQKREMLYAGWCKAVERSKDWIGRS